MRLRLETEGVVIALCLRQTIDHTHETSAGGLEEVIRRSGGFGQLQMRVRLRVIRMESLELRRRDGSAVEGEGVHITRIRHYICVEMLRNSSAPKRVEFLREERHRVGAQPPMRHDCGRRITVDITFL